MMRIVKVTYLCFMLFFCVRSLAQEKTYSSLTPMLSVGNNIAYDIALAPNLNIEYYLPSGQYSFSAEAAVPWWKNKSKELAYQLQHYKVSGDYWFRSPERASLKGKSPYTGHSVGVYLNGGLYDLEPKPTHGYRGEFIGAGVDYSYTFASKKRFRFKLGLSLGWLGTEYEYYEPMDGHHVYQYTKRVSYFGPTGVDLSLVWVIMYHKTGGGR